MFRLTGYRPAEWNGVSVARDELSVMMRFFEELSGVDKLSQPE